MTLEAFIRLVESGVFVALAAISVRQFYRRRTEAAKWLAATFGVLGAVVVAARLVPTPQSADHKQWIVKAIVVIIAVFPYCLYRFGASFAPWGRPVAIAARVSTALLAAATLAVQHFPDARHPAQGWYLYYTLGFLLDWTALSIICVVYLRRAGRGQPAVARQRMRTLGWAAVVLNGSILISTAGGSSPASAVVLWAQTAGLAGAVLFVLGFVPPATLRTMWRREEIEALRRAEPALMVAGSAEEVAQIVLPQAVQLFGALGAVLIDATGAVVLRHLFTAAIPDTVAPLPAPAPVRAPPIVLPNFVAVPLRSGWLALQTAVSTPFFGREELVILETLGHLAGLALDRAELFDRERAGRAILEEREAQLAQAQRLAHLGSFTQDVATGTVTWSDELNRIFGFGPEADGDWADRTQAMMQRIHPADRDAMTEATTRSLTSTEPTSLEYRLLLPDGEIKWVHGHASPVLDDDGRPVGLVGTVQDVTERKAAETEMVYQAMHDSLTGLPNRAMFLDRLALALDRHQRSPAGVAVLFLDLDRFKWLNDSLGHAAGDEVLVEVGRRLLTAMRPGDVVARFGGDEFVVLGEDVDSEADAEAFAQRLATTLAAPIVVAGEETTITVSIGIAVSPGGSRDRSAETLVGDADVAMYHAKELGRDRYDVFHEVVRLAAVARHQTTNAMRRGIDGGEFVVFYQPELDLMSGQVVGVEALVRWDHPQRGLLPPSEFISLAEESGLIVAIGAHVLKTATRQVAAWQGPNGQGPEISLSVNLAARQLMAPDLCDLVEYALASSGLDPALLCLEITESALLEDGDASTRALAQLRAIGVSIGVDDFGTGFSSLTYLRRFPVNILKIDRSFVDGLGRSREDRAIVASVVDLAHALGLTTIAEGVETLEQLAELRAIGCEQGQGYLWSHPLPAEKARRWIDEHRRAAKLVSQPPRTAVRGKAGQQPRRTLIVEDDRSLRTLLRMVLEGDDDYDVVGEAADGRAAIALARHLTPDLVLLDLAMPGMGGLEALPLIQAVAPHANVIVLSGLDPREVEDAAHRLGAKGYLQKGDDPADLLEHLRPLLASA